jgi:hypothetical protein
MNEGTSHLDASYSAIEIENGKKHHLILLGSTS